MFTAEQGTDDPEVVAAMTALFERVAQIEGVSVTSPYTPEGAQFNSQTAPISFAEIAFSERDQAGYIELADEIQALDDDIDVDGLTIEYGGQLFGIFEFPESELLGILAAVIILLIAFGSVLAMGLPIGTAIFGLFVGFGLVGLGSQVFSMPEFAPQMMAMIGLGVGIDYALFIVTRFRENLNAGSRSRSRDRRVGRHVGPRRHVRRHHRDHLAARPVRDGPRVRPRSRHRRRHRRAGDDDRRRHVAARTAGLRRPAHRHHVARRRRIGHDLRRVWHCSASSRA